MMPLGSCVPVHVGSFILTWPPCVFNPKAVAAVGGFESAQSGPLHRRAPEPGTQDKVYIRVLELSIIFERPYYPFAFTLDVRPVRRYL